MKKPFTFMLVLLMLLILTSCGTGNDINGDEQEEAQPDVELEIENIVDTYEKALKAYSWFDLSTLPTDSSTSKEADGMVYYQVNHATIKTYADLENHLRSLFAGDIVNALLDQTGGLYREFDGVLYAMPADRGTDITKGEHTLTFEHISDEKVKIIVEVELLDEDDLATVTGYEIHEFYLEQVEDKWLFTNFYLIY